MSASSGYEDKMRSLLPRVRQLEDRAAIQDLAVTYGFLVDERDYAGIGDMFTDDAVLRTQNGTVKGSGIDAVVGYFEAHLPELGPSNHFVHGHVVEFDSANPDHATGLVASHAELWRGGRPMVTAMRYRDTYRRVCGKWRFSERIQSYMYFVDVREYPEALGARLRMRASANGAQPADWPAPFT